MKACLVAAATIVLGCSGRPLLDTAEGDVAGRREAAPPPAPPQLTVEASAPRKGDVTGLFGRVSLICARRHEAEIACVGEFPMALIQREPDTGFTDRTGLYTDVPFELRGVSWRDLESPYFLGEDGVLRVMDHARGHARLPQPDPDFPPALDFGKGRQACVVTRSGTVECHGTEMCLGQEVTPLREITPGPVEGIEHATALGMGAGMACVIVGDGEVRCWGHVTGDDECSGQTVHAIPGIDDAVQLAMGENEACARLRTGKVKCWGGNYRTGLGVAYPETDFAVEPVVVPGVDRVVDLQGYAGEKIALRDNGEVWIWGWRLTRDDDNPAPRRVAEIEAAIDIAVGNEYGCALLPDHNLRCFGHRIERAIAKGGWSAAVRGRGAVAGRTGVRDLVGRAADGAVEHE